MSVGDYQDHSFLSILSKSIGDSYTNEINNEESKTQPYSKNESEDENNDKKNIELYEANNVILIKKQKDEIQFFIHKKGYTPRIYKGKKCTKIRDILKKYIENIGEKDEIINHFYYENKLIDNLDCTLDKLGIGNLVIDNLDCTLDKLGIGNLDFISCMYL